MSLFDDIIFCLKPRCPKCKTGRLFENWSLDIVKECTVCQAKLGKNDIGDAASVFLIFVLGFTIVPLAWLVESIFPMPYILQIIVWSVVICGAAVVLLPAVKAYSLLLEFRHRRED